MFTGSTVNGWRNGALALRLRGRLRSVALDHIGALPYPFADDNLLPTRSIAYPGPEGLLTPGPEEIFTPESMIG